MDPALASIISASGVALIAGFFALRQTRTVEREKAKATSNTQAMEGVRLQIEGWAQLDEAHRAEIARLQAELDHCHQHHLKEPHE